MTGKMEAEPANDGHQHMVCMNGIHHVGLLGMAIRLNGEIVGGVVAAREGKQGFVVRHRLKSGSPRIEVGRETLRAALDQPTTPVGEAALAVLRLRINQAVFDWDELGPIYEVLRGEVTIERYPVMSHDGTPGPGGYGRVVTIEKASDPV